MSVSLLPEEGHEDCLHPSTPTITTSALPGQHQQQEQLLADAVEKLQRLNELESRKQGCSSHNDVHDSALGRVQDSEGDPTPTQHGTGSGHDTACLETVELRGEVARWSLVDGGGSEEEEEEEEGGVGDEGEFPPRRSCSGQCCGGGASERHEGSFCVACGRESIEGEDEGGELEEDFTPTPPRDDKPNGLVLAPPPLPPDAGLSGPSHPRHHLPHHQLRPPPWGTPLSAKSGHYNHLHPDVLHRQFSPNISLLPVPRIVCPDSASGSGSVGGASLASLAMLGNEYTLDENVYLADMIALKYLGLDSHNTGRDSGPGAPGMLA